MRMFWAALVTGGAVWGLVSARAAQDVYYAESAGVSRINLDAGAVERPLPMARDAASLALDFDAATLYWLDRDGRRILRAPAAGGAIQTVVANLDAPGGIVLDTTQEKLYWSSPGRIQCALSSGGPITDVVVGPRRPMGIAVDAGNRVIYWADRDAGIIGSAFLETGDITTLVSNLDRPEWLALDLDNRYCYWAERDGSRIRRVPLDGAGLEEVVLTGSRATPLQIALNTANQEVFWTSATGTYGAPLASPATITLNVPGTASAIAVTEDTIPDQAVGVWVDFSRNAPFYGTFPWPHGDLASGLYATVTGGKLHFMPGTTPETARIVRELRLIAFGGTVRLGVATP